jgi:putative ABC transport system substrate-binding protein
MEMFKMVVPGLRRVLIMFDPREPEEREAVASARAGAGHLGLTVLEQPVTDPLAVDAPMMALRPGGQDGILTVQSSNNLDVEGRSMEIAAERKLPTMYAHSSWTDWGGLASYGPNSIRQGQQAGRQAARILAGTPPAEIPVELPDRIDFVVNVKTAKKLGLRIPKSVFVLANRVIQ